MVQECSVVSVKGIEKVELGSDVCCNNVSASTNKYGRWRRAYKDRPSSPEPSGAGHAASPVDT